MQTLIWIWFLFLYSWSRITEEIHPQLVPRYLLLLGHYYFVIFKQTDQEASAVDSLPQLEKSPVSTVINLKTENSEERSQKPQAGSSNDSLPPCPTPSNLTGSLPMEINQEITFEEIINKNPSVQWGGCWRPLTASPRLVLH